MQTIHPTAIIDAAAQLGSGVTIGAYSVVGPQVTLGDGVKGQLKMLASTFALDCTFPISL